MKANSRTFLKTLAILFFIFFLNNIYGQQRLVLVDSITSKEVLFKENNLVSIKSSDSLIDKTGKLDRKTRRGLNKLTGRINDISDSTITIRKLYSKKTVTIKLENLYQIKKEKASKFIAKGVLVAAAFATTMFVFNIAPPYAFAIIPVVYLVDLAYPYRTINSPYKVMVQK